MSKFEKLNVSIREGKGTAFARRLRLENKVPAVLYHSGIEGTSLFIEKNELYKALKTGQFILSNLIIYETDCFHLYLFFILFCTSYTNSIQRNWCFISMGNIRQRGLEKIWRRRTTSKIQWRNKIWES